MKNKAFTLIELMIVISIAAMLVAILMPAIMHFRNPNKSTNSKITTSDVTIVELENNIASVKINITSKIELKPAFIGEQKVDIYNSVYVTIHNDEVFISMMFEVNNISI